MSDSFINASNIRSFETFKRPPSIALWNNGGSKVAFIGNDNEAKTYVYKNECLTEKNIYNYTNNFCLQLWL